MMILKNKTDEESLLVDVRTVAKLLSVSERTIRTLTRRGELPVVKILGRVLYRCEDVIEFVRQRAKKESV